MHKKLLRTRSSKGQSKRSTQKSPSTTSSSSASNHRSSKRSPISFQIRRKKEECYPQQQQQQQQQQPQRPIKLDQPVFDPWDSKSTSEYSPTSVVESHFASKKEKGQTKLSQETHFKATTSESMTRNHHRHHANANRSSFHTSQQQTPTPKTTATTTTTKKQSRSIIPGVSKMTMRQTLAVIFSAFWERADLYTDVLALEHDKPSPRQLRLAFFRQGRRVLATPIESPDDMTTISAGMKPIFAVGGGSQTKMVSSGDGHAVQSGVTVSRKAKMKFQAINLAYDLLNDEAKRQLYDEWRLWHCRLPPPSNTSRSPIKQQQQQKPQTRYEMHNEYEHLSNQDLHDIMYSKGGMDEARLKKQYNIKLIIEESSAMGSIVNSKSSLPSILREPTFGKKKKKKKKKERSRSVCTNDSQNSEKKIVTKTPLTVSMVVAHCLKSAKVRQTYRVIVHKRVLMILRSQVGCKNC